MIRTHARSAVASPQTVECPVLWRLTGGIEGGRTTLDALAAASGYSLQETRALVLIYDLEGYLCHRDNDEIELTERGLVWLIMGS